jgi:hypothetical protein
MRLEEMTMLTRVAPAFKETVIHENTGVSPAPGRPAYAAQAEGGQEPALSRFGLSLLA